MFGFEVVIVNNSFEFGDGKEIVHGAYSWDKSTLLRNMSELKMCFRTFILSRIFSGRC